MFNEYRFDCLLCRLEPQHRRFVTEYLKDYDAPAAAIRAGYSARTARHQSSRLFRKRSISEAIDAGQRLQDDWARDLAARLHKRMEALASTSFTDLFDERGNPLPMDKWSAGAEQAVQSITLKRAPGGSGACTVTQLKLANKVRALSVLLDMLTAIEGKAKEEKEKSPKVSDDEFVYVVCDEMLRSMLDRGWILTTEKGETYDRAALEDFLAKHADFKPRRPWV